MLLVFYIFYFIGWTFALPVLYILSRFFIKKWQDGLDQRLTVFDKDFFYIYKKTKPVWFHAVSVGELNALEPVLDHFAGVSVAISVTTKTAYDLAHLKFKKQLEENKFKIFYMPYDHPFLIKRIFKLLKPQALVLLESEIWPALFAEAKNSKVKMAVINAKLSDKSFKSYDALSIFFRPIFNMAEVYLVQSAEYSRKLLRLGVKKDKVFVLGNIKFSSLPKLDNFNKNEFRESLGFHSDNIVLVCASTHEDEETPLIAAFQEMKENFPDLRLVIAPRHPERFKIVFDLVNSAAKLLPQFYTEDPQIETVDDVLIINTIGDLLKFYAIADIAFVGGTLNEKIGGHNPLEPAFFGVPVVSGPFYHKNTQIFEMMLDSEAMLVADTKLELKSTIESLVNNKRLRGVMGTCGKKLTEANAQIVYNVANKLKEYID